MLKFLKSKLFTFIVILLLIVTVIKDCNSLREQDKKINELELTLRQKEELVKELEKKLFSNIHGGIISEPKRKDNKIKEGNKQDMSVGKDLLSSIKDKITDENNLPKKFYQEKDFYYRGYCEVLERYNQVEYFTISSKYFVCKMNTCNFNDLECKMLKESVELADIFVKQSKKSIFTLNFDAGYDLLSQSPLIGFNFIEYKKFLLGVKSTINIHSILDSKLALSLSYRPKIFNFKSNIVFGAGIGTNYYFNKISPVLYISVIFLE